MGIIETDAILLKKTELRETSLLVDFYTRESGKIKGVIKGVRNPQPQFGSVYEAVTLDRIVFYEKTNRAINLVSQCDLLDFFYPLRQGLDRLSFAIYFTELIDATCQYGQANADIYELLLGSLRFLCGNGSARRIARIFEIKLMKYLGMMPVMKRCVNCDVDVIERPKFSVKNGGVLCPDCYSSDSGCRPILTGTVNFIESVAALPLDKVTRVKVAKQVGRDVEHLMRGFLEYHLQKRFRTVIFMENAGII